jgi:hypothetical protein
MNVPGDVRTRARQADQLLHQRRLAVSGTTENVPLAALDQGNGSAHCASFFFPPEGESTPANPADTSMISDSDKEN